MIPCLLSSLWLAVAAPVPQAGPSFPAEVEIITIDAVVVDGDGVPVTGLRREDFRVFEDGRPREVVSFEAFARGETAIGEAPAAVVATNERGTELRGRAFALLLDDVFTPLQAAAEVRRAAESFLRHSVGPGDEVTIATTSGNAYWSAGLPEGLDDLLAVAARFKGRDTGGRYGTQEYTTSHLRPEEMRYGTLQVKRMTELQAYDIVRGRMPGDQPMAQEIDQIRRQR